MGRIALVLMSLLFIAAAQPPAQKVSGEKYNRLPVEPASSCASNTWDVVVTRQEEESFTLTRAKCVTSGRTGRVEIEGENGGQPQVIIFDTNDLYVLDDASKTARLFGSRTAQAAGFLSRVFITIGMQRKDRIIAGEEKLGTRDCFIYTYKLMRQSGPFQVWSTVTEWRYKTENTLQKAVIKTDRMEMKMGKMTTVIPASTETYEAGGIRCGLFPKDGLNRVPPGYTVMDMKQQYEEKLKEAKNIEPAQDSQMMTVKMPTDRGAIRESR